MADIRKTGLIAGAAAGAVVLFLNFGPVLFDRMLSGNEVAQPDPDTKALLKQNAELIESLNQTLERLSDGPEVTESAPTANSSTHPPALTTSADGAPPQAQEDADISTALNFGPADTENPAADLPRTAVTAPEPASVVLEAEGQPPAVKERPQSSTMQAPVTSFSIFANEQFALCGYQKFSASLSPGMEIVLRTTDRTTPISGFRGFERKLPARTPTKLWDGCTVAVDQASVSGIVRIAISVVSGEL